MVMPGYNEVTPEWPRWRRTFLWLGLISLAFGVIWFAASGDLKETLIAISLPWVVALCFASITLIWGIIIIPPMLLIQKLLDRKR